MPFWTYMLHCRGGYFYVSHTDDLERRIGEHQSGLIPGFTADHLPVELVWSDQFQNRDDAKAAERKLKGWSRAKKLALIQGDWERISAQTKKKDSASTSSAWTGEGESKVEKVPTPPESVRPELVEGPSFSLQPHPQNPAHRVRTITASICMTDPNDMLVEFRVEGSEQMLVPESARPLRRDELWQTTCFEIFLSVGGGSYFEFNFSPSTEWAAYSFGSYRQGMSPLEMVVEPHIEFAAGPDVFTLEADLDLGQVPPGPLEMALSAVIEETDGTKSYWALAHPPGKPDFHHPTCFAATLPPPSST